MTPAWYPWLARAFAGFTFFGTLLLWTNTGFVFKPLLFLPRDPWTEAILFFVTVLALQHLLLHVEERFSLAWSPYAFGALIALTARVPKLSVRSRWIFYGMGGVAILIYWIQVLTWDTLARQI